MKIIPLLVIFIALTVSCTENKNEKINIFVGIRPQKFIVEKITGQNADITVLVKPGMSPENFEPLPSQLLKLSTADLYFKIGMQFEERLIKSLISANNNLRIINTTENISLREVESFESIFSVKKHSDNSHSKHHHGLYDPHVWLSPTLVKLQSKTIYESFSGLDKPNKSYYAKNYNNFIREIDSVKKIITNNLSEIEQKYLLVFHPAWGYFCDEFGLQQIPIEFEGKEPSLSELPQLINFIKENNLKFILAESQNISLSLNSISKELNIKIIHHDPLAENYYDNLIQLSEIIRDNN